MNLLYNRNILQKKVTGVFITVGIILALWVGGLRQLSLLDILNRMGFAIVGAAFIGYIFSLFLTWLCREELQKLEKEKNQKRVKKQFSSLKSDAEIETKHEK